MHSSRMRTARSSSRLWREGLPQCMLGYTRLGLDTPLTLDHPPGVGLDTPPVQTPNLPPGPGPRHPPL